MFFDSFDSAQLESQLSGDRFTAVYRLFGNENTARSKAEDICAEQTVEFPVKLLPKTIAEKITGTIENFEKESEGIYRAAISFAEETAAVEFTQFINVLFGNISMKQGIQLVSVIPSKKILDMLPGPQFGISGIREITGVPQRPPLFTALKPMGLSAENLAELAAVFTQGGIDIIKDDHGLSDQVFAPFEERVQRCAAAVKEANVKFNRKAVYVANITAPFDKIIDRAYRAKELGAGGVMLSPGISGFDSLRKMTEAGLPVFAHPAWMGGMAMNPMQGVSCGVLYGTLMRLAGADAVIFPNFGGRFPLSHQDCMDIVTESRKPAGTLRPMFPSPAGGMELKNIRSMIENYGSDMLLLIGSGLFSCGDDILENCRKFIESAEGC
ncbi:MAG: hypothetical protein LBT46_01545 [Planctomycetaceae bacterium]|jgi:ribulose-bisphosphate carboxylase large chain|nr:hypothetical protein [Planctomycetaceae bacterium]